MGKDINGRIVTADLASMPHVLIAGSTGSGKSVAINAMIMSLLYRTTPAQVRLILVDPKRVELGMYEGIPHLFTPIITEPKLAANALRNAVREMERRLKLLASRSVRNIDQYNKLFEGAMPSLFDDGQEEQPLPYIVIIIDELADLMMLDRSNVEESITRLAQMARAVGIHLVLATQRPSSTSSPDSSRRMCPRASASASPPRSTRGRSSTPTVLKRSWAGATCSSCLRGPAASCACMLPMSARRRPPPSSRSGKTRDRPNMSKVSSSRRAKKDRAWKAPATTRTTTIRCSTTQYVWCSRFGKASTSLLQRRLRIGYGRAAHLIDLMERDGLVGPADGSRPRELLKAPGWLHEIGVADE